MWIECCPTQRSPSKVCTQQPPPDTVNCDVLDGGAGPCMRWWISTQYLHSVDIYTAYIYTVHTRPPPRRCVARHCMGYLTTPHRSHTGPHNMPPIIWSKSFILLGFYILNWVKWPKENQRIQFLQEADIWKIFASHLWLQQPEGAAQAVSWLSVSFSVLFELFSVHWISAWKNCKYWFLCLGTHCYAAVVVVVHCTVGDAFTEH